MDPTNVTTSKEVPDIRNMTQAELIALANAHTKKNGPPVPSYSEKNTLLGWTDDGKGVWVLPVSKANFDRFEDVARTHPGLGQCEILKLAGADFFADWRDSDRATAVKNLRA
ncbi:hypothetical protein QBC47DRAFT_368698 [Echria macrotheca]|uniref:Uncharacterized protein n=1 Tax=Echria macrotheca TaxID=438768 RepID=A0AAJ0BME3_9PEZI|nr:hypothetical protein QBC47DRAFT_368698 [Echria macrotheca]